MTRIDGLMLFLPLLKVCDLGGKRLRPLRRRLDSSRFREQRQVNPSHLVLRIDPPDGSIVIGLMTMDATLLEMSCLVVTNRCFVGGA